MNEGQYDSKNVEHISIENIEVVSNGMDWKSRHLEAEKRKAEIRDRIHKQTEQDQKSAKDYFRPAKPTPSIYDSDLKRVAVYARVSTSSEEQISSIENQTLYYTKKIAETENWNLQDIYSDEGKSGTSLRKRDAFKRMMRDAKDQKMDLIICASISRFARNFSDCMTQIAALKTMHPAHPIGVYFETENIYTLNPSSQYSLDIQALLADWESGNKSRRMILSYDQRIMTGQYPVADLMGYRHTKDGQLVIEPEEAKTVRFIFLAFIQGYIVDLANELVNKYDMYIAYAVRKQTPKNYKDYFDKRIHLIEVRNFGRAINPIKDIAAFFEVKKIAAEIKPDLIHLHSSKAGAIGRFAFDGKIPMFYTPHGYSFLMENCNPAKRRVFKLIESVCAKRNCTTISCSVGEHQETLKLTKNAAYVNNGINMEELQEIVDQTEKVEHPFTVFTLGRICYQKNPTLFNTIAESLPDVRFVWIGDGELREELKSKNIEISGWVDRSTAIKYAVNRMRTVCCYEMRT